ALKVEALLRFAGLPLLRAHGDEAGVPGSRGPPYGSARRLAPERHHRAAAYRPRRLVAVETLRQGAGRLVIWALVAPVCTALLGWIALAIYFSPLEPPWTRGALAVLVPIGATIALILVRPLRRVSAMVQGRSSWFSLRGSPSPLQRSRLAARRCHVALRTRAGGTRTPSRRCGVSSGCT